jgi:hypothetical protein
LVLIEPKALVVGISSWLGTRAVWLGHSLTVVKELEVCFGIASRLGRLRSGLVRGVLICAPVANILSSHTPGGFHLLGGDEILKGPLTIVLRLGLLVNGNAFLRSILRVAAIGKVKVRILVRVGANIAFVLLKGLIWHVGMLITIEEAHRLEVLTLASLGG